MGLVPSVITPAKELYATGFVVGATSKVGAPLDKGDAADRPAWRIRYGKQVVDPKREVLAPGLVLYQITSGPVAELLDDKQQVVGKITVVKGKRARVIAAPKVKQVKFSGRHGRFSFTHVVAELDGNAPDGMIAMVVLDAKGKPVAWGRVDAAKSSVDLVRRSRCGVLPNGTVVPSPGEKVTLIYITEGGEKSSPSKPLTVTGALEPNR